jgi:carboxypeptidase PM20D1
VTARRRIASAIAIVVAIVAVLLVTVLGRALLVRSRQVSAQPAAELRVEEAPALGRLSRAIQFRTISDDEPDPTRPVERTAFVTWLMGAYPNVHRVLTREVIGKELFFIPGRDRNRICLHSCCWAIPM